jgi:tetratricopeptide (TPR) repeat protein
MKSHMREMSRFAFFVFIVIYVAVYYGPPAHAEQATSAAAPKSAGPSVAAEPSTPAASAAASELRRVAEADPQFERALPYLEQGEVTFNSKNYEAALAEFEHAYGVLKGHPKQCETLKNIGLCHERLFRYDRALEYFHRYLSECGAGAKERDKIEQKIEVLKDLLGVLKVTVNKPAEVWVDNVLIGKAPGDLLVSGGRHTVELRAIGYESEQREISVPGGAIHELSFTLKEISEYKGISPVFFGSAAGLAVISAGIGTWFGVQALSERSDADERLSEQNLEKHKKAISSSALKADVFFATAGVLTLGAGILCLFTDWGREQKTAPTDKSEAKMNLVPMGTDRGVAIQLLGSF